MADDGALLERITLRSPFLECSARSLEPSPSSPEPMARTLATARGLTFADAGNQRARVAEATRRPVGIMRRSDIGFVVQPKRWAIERTFASIGINRRLARDFERFAETAKALFQIAMIKLMTRRIARYRDF